eukprot:1229283-Pleurochrysis_carterae.AAC.1
MNPGLSANKQHCTLLRAGRSGRTPEATVPSGTGANDAVSPCRPRNLSSDWEEERRGPDLLVRTSKFPSPGTSRPQEPIEEGSDGVSAVPVPFDTDTADAPTEVGAGIAGGNRSSSSEFAVRSVGPGSAVLAAGKIECL